MNSSGERERGEHQRLLDRGMSLRSSYTTCLDVWMSWVGSTKSSCEVSNGSWRILLRLWRLIGWIYHPSHNQTTMLVLQAHNKWCQGWWNRWGYRGGGRFREWWWWKWQGGLIWWFHCIFILIPRICHNTYCVCNNLIFCCNICLSQFINHRI